MLGVCALKTWTLSWSLLCFFVELQPTHKSYPCYTFSEMSHYLVVILNLANLKRKNTGLICSIQLLSVDLFILTKSFSLLMNHTLWCSSLANGHGSYPLYVALKSKHIFYIDNDSYVQLVFSASWWNNCWLYDRTWHLVRWTTSGLVTSGCQVSVYRSTAVSSWSVLLMQECWNI